MFSSFFKKGLVRKGLIALLVFLETPGVFAQSFTQSTELLVIDQEVQAFLDKWQIPGATVALAKDDKLLYAKGFGKADAGKPMQAQNLFRIASLSKPLTAMAIMKLVQDGSIKLENPVFGSQGILNSDLYANPADSRIEDITVLELLEHTAGWDRETSPEGDPMFSSIKIAEAMHVPAPADAVSIIRYMLQQPLDFTPGTHFAYSNLGYNILGRVIEQVTDLPYETYVRTAILQPLGITNMFLGKNLYEDKNPLEVRYYDLNNRKVKSVSGEGKKVDFTYGGFNLEAMDAHGGWIASAPDLIRLLMALDPNTKTPLLNPDLVKIMTSPDEPANGYAKGWFVNPSGNWWHTGALVGSSSLMAHLKNGFKWVLLLNARPEDEAFYPELDRLMWKATAKVTTWPDQNLFEPSAPQMALQEGGNLIQ